MEKLELNYLSPASQWEEVLPLGNGNLGAMIWGTITEEKIGLNHDRIWSGYPRDKNNYNAKNYLGSIRKAILDKDFKGADEIAEKHMLGEYGECYLPLGNLLIKTSHSENIENYSRSLSLNSAIA